MNREESKVTIKYQTTIPRKIRKHLGVRPGEKVEWHVVRGMVVVDVPRKVKNPVEFLTSQIKLDLDAVKLVREAREEFK
ncbi:MAG: type II toxin-antitoxin system PrlF family antitoxin [Candidatus Brockarchaeota archaeon]|nr:type II toxin-antitoxin system PrlF family antitoxin [Candidatus Brockarchaeota archaeon]MBO3809530.1 type II toxin-antitoxin system PrlF family antitoxin [Candidatus Brockarchaeota archaeon]